MGPFKASNYLLWTHPPLYASSKTCELLISKKLPFGKIINFHHSLHTVDMTSCGFHPYISHLNQNSAPFHLEKDCVFSFLCCLCQKENNRFWQWSWDRAKTETKAENITETKNILWADWEKNEIAQRIIGKLSNWKWTEKSWELRDIELRIGWVKEWA